MNTIPSHEMSHMFYSRSWSQCEIESVYDKYYDQCTWLIMHEILIYTLLITWLILRWYQFYGVKFRGKWEGIHFEQLWFFYLFFNKWATVVFLGTSIKRNNIHFWMVLIFFLSNGPPVAFCFSAEKAAVWNKLLKVQIHKDNKVISYSFFFPVKHNYSCIAFNIMTCVAFLRVCLFVSQRLLSL